MRRLFFVTMIVALLFAASAVPVKASTPIPFYIEKVCGVTENECTIQPVGAPLEFLSGATIQYFNHKMVMNDAGMMHQAASILITAENGSSAPGHVSWVFYNGEFWGTVTIQPGTGSFAGFHANAKIDVVGANRYSFTGTYFFTP